MEAVFFLFDSFRGMHDTWHGLLLVA